MSYFGRNTGRGGAGNNSTVCKFFLEGKCRYGESCKFYHPPRGSNQTSSSSATLPYHLNRDHIKADFTFGDDRPTWPLSAYGPGKDAPRQLIEGALEQSPEEVRLQYYLAAASGSTEKYQQTEQVALNEASTRAQGVLNDLDGAIKYVIDGKDAHPNRDDGVLKPTGNFNWIDKPTYNANAATTTAPSSNSGAGFGAPPSTGSNLAAFGQPSAVGGGSGFGHSSAPASGFGGQSGASSGFGRPSPLGGGSTAFGQPSALGGGSTSFGRPSALGGGNTSTSSPFGGTNTGGTPFGQTSNTGGSTFGQASTPNAGSAFGQASALGGGGAARPSPFGAAASGTPAFGQSAFGTKPATGAPAFGQASQPIQQTSTFGQPSQPGQSAFGQPSQPGQSAFGQPSQPAQQPSAFGQSSQSAFGQASQPGQRQQSPFASAGNPTGGGTGFGQSTFGQPSAPGAGPNSSAFGQPTASGQKPSPFGAPSQQPSAFGANGSNATPFGAQPQTSNASGFGAVSTAQPSRPLTSIKGQRVFHEDRVPFYMHPQTKKKERIWMADGAPGPNADVEASPETYEAIGAALKQVYDYVRDNGTFKDGFMPEVPPKREWVNWDL